MRFAALFLGFFLGASSLAALSGCGGNVTVSGSGGSDPGGDGGGGSGGDGSDVQHASCNSPTPSPMPAVPQVNSDATGRPMFDHWRDMDCGGVSAFLCGAAGSSPTCSMGLCLQSDAAVGGVCDYKDADIWCDGEGEAVGYGNGTCWMCAPIESHAAACCAGLAGFDCRAWPYPSDGKPGMLCARHADCEPGLVCGASMGQGYGICQCPGTDPDTVTPTAGCGF